MNGRKKQGSSDGWMDEWEETEEWYSDNTGSSLDEDDEWEDGDDWGDDPEDDNELEDEV